MWPLWRMLIFFRCGGWACYLNKKKKKRWRLPLHRRGLETHPFCASQRGTGWVVHSCRAEGGGDHPLRTFHGGVGVGHTSPQRKGGGDPPVCASRGGGWVFHLCRSERGGDPPLLRLADLPPSCERAAAASDSFNYCYFLFLWLLFWFCFFYGWKILFSCLLFRNPFQITKQFSSMNPTNNTFSEATSTESTSQNIELFLNTKNWKYFKNLIKHTLDFHAKIGTFCPDSLCGTFLGSYIPFFLWHLQLWFGWYKAIWYS